MKRIIETRSRTYKDRIELIYLNKSVAVRYKKNTNLPGSGGDFFVSREDLDAALEKNNNVFKAINLIDRRYDLYSKDFWNQLENIGFIGKKGDVYGSIEKGICKSIFETDFDNVDEDRLLYFYSDAHLFYELGSINPISYPIRLNYIGGITNRYFDLDKAMSALNDSPHTWDVELISIPYYNRDDDCTHAIEFTAKIPTDIYNKLCEYHRDIAKVKFWSCRVKDSYIFNPHNSINTKASFDADFFGLKDCYVDKQEEDY